MAAKRKAAKRKAKPAKPKEEAKRKTKRKRRPATVGDMAPAPLGPRAPLTGSRGVPGVETSQEALVCIAQDAVVILRHELAWRAVLSVESPGSVSLFDCVSLLRLTTELGAAARRGSEEVGQKANYDRLTPGERVQLAALLLKVDYVETDGA